MQYDKFICDIAAEKLIRQGIWEYIRGDLSMEERVQRIFDCARVRSGEAGEGVRRINIDCAEFIGQSDPVEDEGDSESDGSGSTEEEGGDV